MILQGSKKAAATLVALSAFVPNLFLIDEVDAQATAQAPISVSASIVNPLAVTPSLAFSMNFKTFAISGTGSYAIQPGGTGTISSGLTLNGQSAGTAKFNVPQSAAFTLSIPTFKAGSSIVLTIAGGGVSSKKMTAKSILFAGKTGMSNATGTLKVGKHSLPNMKVTNPGDTGRVAVGARIFFDANQVTGVYTGTYIVRITL